MRYNGKASWNGVLGYSSHGQLFGLQLMRKLKRVSFGGEVLYSQADRTGGLTLGTRFDAEDGTVASLTLNPIMGHIQANTFFPLEHKLQAACRYDFNMHSLRSDVSFGVGKQIESGMIGLRWSGESGIGVTLSGRLRPELLITLSVQSHGKVAPAIAFDILTEA